MNFNHVSDPTYILGFGAGDSAKERLVFKASGGAVADWLAPMSSFTRPTAISNSAMETPVAPWQHLVRRNHPWRKQLYLKGKNLTARQLVGAMDVNDFDIEMAAENYHLAAEAVREARLYVDQNKQLIETESEIERLMLKREGVACGPERVS